MQSLFPEEQLVQARGWANAVVEKALVPEATEMWLLRQCMRYMPAQLAANYMSMNIGNTKPQQVEAFWVGNPPDWEGAVRMMEASFSVTGWSAVMFPTVEPKYTPEQAARILRLIQQTSDAPKPVNHRTREEIFFKAFDESKKPTASMGFWREPQRWLAGHKLKHQDQITIWCAYAMLADPDLLLQVSKGLRWKGWEVGEYLLDWEKVTSNNYIEREAAAEQLWAAHTGKIAKAPLPKDIDFTMQM